MSQHVIGIDLGTYSIKVSSLDLGKTKEGFSYQDRIIPAPYGEEEFNIKDILTDIVQEGININETIFMTLPYHGVSIHNLYLPFKNVKEIEQTLPFELEELVPFDLEDYFTTFRIVSKDSDGSHIQVAITKNEQFNTFFEDLAEIGLNPKIITPHLLSYSLLNQEDIACQDECFAILDLGHSTSLMTIFKGGEAIFYHNMNLGGHYINNSIANAWDMNYFGVDKIKIENGRLFPNGLPSNLSEEMEILYKSIDDHFKKIILEVRRGLGSFRKEHSVLPEKIFITGGSSQIDNCQDYFNSNLGIVTEQLEFAEKAISINGNINMPEAANTKSHAICLANLPEKKDVLLNMRKGKFAYTGDWDFLKDKTFQIAVSLLLMFFCATGFMSMQYYVTGEKKAKVTKKIKKFSKKMFGVSKTKIKWIEREMQKYNSPTTSIIPQITAYSILGEITQNIPEDMEVNLNLLDISLHNVFIKGELNSFEDVEVLHKALRKYKCLKNLQNTQATTDKHSKKVNFTFDGKISC